MDNTFLHIFNNFWLSRRCNEQPKINNEFTKHSHNYYEILLLVEGDVTYTLENRSCVLKPFDLILIKPQEYHYLQFNNSNRYERYLIQFRSTAIAPQILDLIKSMESFYSLQGTPIISLFKKIDLYQNTFHGDTLELLSVTTLTEIIILLSSYFKDSTNEPDIVSNALDSILKYISNNLHNDLSVESLCKKFFMSKSKLFDLFKKTLKTTPMKYITTKRIAKAQELLSCDTKPSEVYLQCGYKDYSTFYRAFVKEVGHSPSSNS